MNPVVNRCFVVLCLAWMAFTDVHAQKLKIGIVSIGTRNPEHIATVKKSLKSFYRAKVTDTAIQLPIDSSLLSKPSAQLRAKVGTNFQALNTYSTSTKLAELGLTHYDAVIGITDSALSIGELYWMAYSPQEPNQYLMRGYAESDLKAATISTYKLKKEVSNAQEFKADLAKVARHEMAHLLGMGHCSGEHCLMRGAQGFKAASNTFCPECLKKFDKKYLKKRK